MNEWSIPILVAIVSALLGFVSSLILAWYKYRNTEVSASQAAEIVDRGTFRTHLMQRVRELEEENSKLREKLDDREDD